MYLIPCHFIGCDAEYAHRPRYFIVILPYNKFPRWYFLFSLYRHNVYSFPPL